MTEIKHVISTGAPYCPLPATDPRRGYTRSEHTDVARTIREYSPGPRDLTMLDDYDLTDALGHLATQGAFRA